MTDATDEFFVMRPGGPGDPLFITDYTAPRPYDFDFWKGVPLQADGPAELRGDDPGAPRTDLLWGVYEFPVVSERFRQALQAAGAAGEVEYHPVRLVFPDGEADESYRMMNVLGLVAGLDRAASEFETLGETNLITRMIRMVVNPAALRERHVARLDELPQYVLVRGDVRRRLEETGITGVEFVPSGEFHMS